MKIGQTILVMFLLVIMISCGDKSNDSATDFDLRSDSDLLGDSDDAVSDNDAAADDGESVDDDATPDETVDWDQNLTPPPASEPFITVWKTDNLDEHNSYQSHEDQIELPLVENGYYNFLVDWGDGHQQVIRSWDSALKRHTYSEVGSYTVTITGILTGWAFYEYDEDLRREIRKDADKLLEVKGWGCFEFGDTEGQFFGAKNLLITATDKPDLSRTKSAKKMFEGCSLLADIPGVNKWDMSKIETMEAMFSSAVVFNQDISMWDVSQVTTMERMFSLALQFNQDISPWDVSHVTTMKAMFEHAELFNQDISSWKTSSLTNVEKMFMWAKVFNQNIDTWDVSKVTTMKDFFWGTRDFNQNIASWDVSQVTDMSGLFYWSTLFNQDLSMWNVGNVTTMAKMFEHTLVFDQNLSSWSVEKVTDMTKMFAEIELSTANYDALLIGWAAQTVQSGIVLDVEASQYTAGAAATARQKLIDDFSWTINDGGELGEVVGDEDTLPDEDI
ncbi:DUF285 domain-containing protein [bacterium]|nr:DUF285 domain-containing protein [bacterium]